jgi:Amt family ammonium transporter
VGGLAIGFAAGVICFFGVSLVKTKLKVDDSLDVLAVHGFGGATGVILTAVFGATALGGLGHSDLTIGGQLGIQIVGVAATLAWTAVLTFIIIKVVGALVGGLRVSEEAETEGLDLITHGERGYEF